MISGLRRLIKKISGRETKENPAVFEFDSNEISATFKKKYWNFKSLLSINNTILKIMSEMELALRGNKKFSMEFIRANCISISVNIYKLIEKINEISGNRYETLYHAFADIQYKINQIIEKKEKPVQGLLVMPIEDINKDSTKYTGSKMANLGEIMNMRDLSAPHGFVLTASAYNLFLNNDSLKTKISQQLQSVDIEDMAMLEKACLNIENLIIQSRVPLELEKAMLEEYRRLEEKTEKDVKVSMRSSALGEDSEEASFAGQYRTELNVSSKELVNSYKRIIAGKYSPRAVTYRFNKGFSDEDIVMCVGCVEMVKPVASGVMYSRDPGDISSNQIVINAVKGLGKSVVEGSTSPDLFVVSREQGFKVVKKEIHAENKNALNFSSKKNFKTPKKTETEKSLPAITDLQAQNLAKQAVILEEHFQTPQDIEWTIEKNNQIKILQTRPLKQISSEDHEHKDNPDIRVDNRVIISGGVTANQGVACGPAFILNSYEDIYKFPRGSVLVAKKSLPKWAAILNHAVAIVTDKGGITGHLATVSREFGIPALFDTLEATSRIKNKAVITVDAGAGKIYEGKAETLLKAGRVQHTNIIKGSPVYVILEKMLKHISPLNLTDPSAVNFTPDGCHTCHDITRLCHEKAVEEMFDYGRNNRNLNAGKRLVSNGVQTQWMLVDLGDGLIKGEGEKNTVELENIASAPMLALWEGITAVEWEGPPPVDTKGLMSIMVESTMNRNLSTSTLSNYSQNDCAIISKNFCNLSCRFGYHYSVVQTFISDQSRENYIKFRFKGGAADLTRKLRRMQLIKAILGKYDFQVQIHEDHMNATVEGYDKSFLLKRLKMIGYLTMHTRQLDMIMGNPGKAAYYKRKMLEDISSWIP